MSQETDNCLNNCPKLISSYKTPKVYWYQTDTTVHLRILLSDVKKYFIKATDDSFIFRTDLKGDKYYFGIKLCGIIAAEWTTHELFGREIKIRFSKARKYIKWPRLQASTEKNNFIMVDPEHIIEKKLWDDPYAVYEEKETFEDYKKRKHITNIMPEGFDDSDCNSSDDERSFIGYDQ